MNSIKLLRLVNREEIVAEVVLDGTGEIIVKNPLNVMVIPSQVRTEDTRVGLAPWANFSDDKEFSINKDTIVCIMTPIPQLEQQYTEMFSKIITPSKNLILP